MKKRILLIVLLVGIGICAFAQTKDDSASAYRMFQGETIYEDGMMKLLTDFREQIWAGWSDFIEDAKALAAIFMTIFFALKSYEMMSGDKNLEIMPLLRPFGLCMVILWWGVFVKMVAFPTDVITQQAETRWKTAQLDADNLRVQRAKLMIEMVDSLYSYQSQTQIAEKESDTWYGQAWDAVSSTVKQGISTVITPLLEMRERLRITMQLFFTQLLEVLAIWALRLGTYLVFTLQLIYSTMLIILGPFAVAVSILPAYRDSFTTWVARFISVNLYGAIAYIIMWMQAYFQQYAMLAEIQRYNSILHGITENKMAAMASFTSNGILSFGTVIITFLIGAISMFTVPSISTWIVSTSGTSSASSTFGRQSVSMVRGLTRVVSGAL